MSVRSWMMERPTNPPARGVTILMWLILVATPLGGLYGFWQVWNDREESKCEQRVDTRDDLRRLFDGIFDYFDPGADSDTVTGLRILLDDTYPPITVSECLNGTA